MFCFVFQIITETRKQHPVSKPKEIINKNRFKILVLWNTEYKIRRMSTMSIEIQEIKHEQKKIRLKIC